MGDEPRRETRRVRRGRILAVGLVGLTVVAGGAVADDRWRHPTVFFVMTNDARPAPTFTDRRTVGETTAYVVSGGRAGLDPTAVSIVAARPDVLANTSGATLGVVVCESSRSAGEGFAAIHARELPHYCRRILPARGATMQVAASGSGDQLVLEVTPHHAGVVRVRGLAVTYRSGWQRGTQHLDTGVLVSAPAP